MSDSEDHGGGHLAPVIPLFGSGSSAARKRPTSDAAWHPTWAQDAADATDEAPSALRSRESRVSAERAREPRGVAPERTTPPARRAGPVFVPVDDGEDDARTDGSSAGRAETDGTGARDGAGGEVDPRRNEDLLVRRLRSRSLSVSEARAFLAERGSDAEDAERVLSGLRRYGYLDDAALAEQLVHAGVDRKGQGRHVIAQTLAKRGVPREVADAALAVLADDDAERALEFARTKARPLAAVPRDTALRRLAGQLARRGYSSHVALSAARQALDELG